MESNIPRFYGVSSIHLAAASEIVAAATADPACSQDSAASIAAVKVIATSTNKLN